MKNSIVRDKFISKLLGYDAFIIKKYNIQKLSNLKKPFFITLKSKSKINKSNSKKTKDFNISLESIMVNYERKFLENKSTFYKCRNATRKDIPQLKKICLEKTSGSRFYSDKKLNKKFRESFRFEWLLNYFRGKRGNFLIVAYKEKKILGFILLIKIKNGLRIDLIVTKKTFYNKKVGVTLINFANNNLIKNKQKIYAGTNVHNIQANNFYKKVGFQKTKISTYNYHIHSN